MRRSLRPRATAKLSNSVNHQLNMYALATGAAGLGVLALAPTADAKIVYTPAHTKVIFGIPVDLNHDGIADFYLSEDRHYDVQVLGACQYLYRFSSGSFCSVGTRGPNAMITIADGPAGKFAAALRYGEKIQNARYFAKGQRLGLGGYDSGSGSNTNWYGPWFNGGKGVKHRYLGLKFKIKGRFHFGWARITVKIINTDEFEATLTGYAYETIPGKGIIAGKTKGSDVITVDPASLGHLAVGAPAIPARRRAKQTVDPH